MASGYIRVNSSAIVGPRPQVPRSQAELAEHLSEQVTFLKASAASFDAGFLGEAKRLAHTIRVLVHDTKRSRSLLGLLGLKSLFLDTALPPAPGNIMPQAGLVMMGLGGPEGDRYLAMGDGTPYSRWVTFDEWWGCAVFVDDHKQVLTRRNLVLIVANQDGGSHVDPTLDEVYARLTRDNSMGWLIVAGQVQRPMPEPARASVRQIAHELLRTLDPSHGWKPEYNVGMYAGGMAAFNGPVPPSFDGVRRNDPCPCGSGKKFKTCHGDARAA